MTRKQYSETYKAQAVELALSADQPYTQTAKDLSIVYKTLCQWIKDMKPDNPTQPVSLNPHELEKQNRQLRKQVEQLKLEIDFLKKASAYFAKPSRK